MAAANALLDRPWAFLVLFEKVFFVVCLEDEGVDAASCAPRTWVGT